MFALGPSYQHVGNANHRVGGIDQRKDPTRMGSRTGGI